MIDDQGRPEPPLVGAELAMLTGFLDYQRATLEWKCSGLDAAGLRQTVATSTMTLAGLVKHMTYVENEWFSRRLSGHDRLPPWDAVDWAQTPKWEFDSANEDEPTELFQAWRAAIALSQELTTQAVAAGGLDQMASIGFSESEVPNLRWILIHMIEEYARHNGHADLLRESIDGETGE